MSILVIAEHDNAVLKAATFNTITAAAKMGSDITILVAGHNCGAVAEAAAKVVGIKKVLLADAPHYGHQLARDRKSVV